MRLLYYNIITQNKNPPPFVRGGERGFGRNEIETKNDCACFNLGYERYGGSFFKRAY